MLEWDRQNAHQCHESSGESLASRRVARIASTSLSYSCHFKAHPYFREPSKLDHSPHNISFGVRSKSVGGSGLESWGR